MRALSSARIYLVLFLFILALVFWNISFNTPYLWDDYWLNFVIDKNADGSLKRTACLVSSWDDLVTSWFTRRDLCLNGRISDVVCTIVMRLGGKGLFSVLNTAAMLSNVILFSLLCFRRLSLGTVVIVTAGLLLVLPHVDYTIFWMAGACNYLWGSVFLLIFLLCLQKINTTGKSHFPIIICGSIAGFCCGVWHEGLAAPLVGGMAAYWLIERIHGRKQSSGYLWLLASSLAGTAICLSAPSLWLRCSGGIQNSEKGALLVFCISSVIIIWRGGIPLLLFLFLFWKKRHLLHSPLGWMALAFIAEAIATCNTGSAGGSFYYMSITILILFLQSTADWWKKKERAGSIALIPLICIACAYEYMHMREMGKAFRSIFSLPKDHGACIVDWPEEKGGIPWFLYRSLPKMRSEQPYYYLGKLFGHEDFIVIFRKEKLDSNFYENFHGLAEDKVHLIQREGRYIIRLPKDWYLSSGKIWLYSSKIGEIQLREEEWWLSSRLYHYLKGDTLGNYTLDWHDGFRYVILPPSIVEWDAIRLELSKDYTFGSAEKGENKEIIMSNP